MDNVDEATTGALNIASGTDNGTNATLSATNTLADLDLETVTNPLGTVGTQQWYRNGIAVTAPAGTAAALNTTGGTATYTLRSNFTDGPFGTETVVAAETYLVGTGGGNTINTTVASETVMGLNGNDTLRAAATLPSGTDGNDVINGGAGTDVYDLSLTTFGATVDLAAGTATSSWIGTDTLIGIENATGSSGDDTLIGNAGDNVLNGGNGVDIITGAAGNDTLNGGGGNDTFIMAAGDGNDTINGGGGVDTINFAGTTAAAIVSTGSASSTDIGSNILLSIENIIAGEGSDTIIVNGAANVIFGNGGDDNIQSGGSGDTVWGGAGNDTIDGGTGNDIIDGGADNDTITGGTGVDTMDGGIGDDTFVFALGHTGNGGNRDVINGFEAGDKIDLSGYAGTFTIVPAFTAGVDTQIRFDTTTVAGSTLIHIDRDNDTGTEDQILLQGYTGALGSGNFNL